MYIYILLFTISSMIFYISEKSKSSIVENISATFAIFIISVFAGIRASSVGTDVNVYGVRFYSYAVSSQSIGQLKQLLSITGEKNDELFHIMNYILSRFSSNYHVGLFFYELIIVSVVYLAFRRLRNLFGISVSLGMFFFLFTLFNPSLNLMKQTIAVAITFLAITYLVERNIKVYFLLIAIAFFMHGSALIGIPIYIVFMIFKNSSEKRSIQPLKFVMFWVIVLISIYFIGNIVELLVSIGLVRVNYLNYLSGGIYSSNSGVNLYSLMAPIFSIIYIGVTPTKQKQRIENSEFWISMTILAIVTSLATIVSSYLGRIGNYFLLPMLSYQMILWVVDTSKTRRRLMQTFLILVIVVAWCHDIAIENFNNTIPYIIGD